jgi:hypothetical protein
LQEAEALYLQHMVDEYCVVQSYQEQAQLIPSVTENGTIQALS